MLHPVSDCSITSTQFTNAYTKHLNTIDVLKNEKPYRSMLNVIHKRIQCANVIQKHINTSISNDITGR